MRIDDDPVAARQAGRRGQRIVRLRTGADDDEIGAQPIARARDCRDAAVTIRLNGRQRGTDTHVDAMPRMCRMNSRRRLLVADARENAGRDLDDGCHDAQRGRGGRHFEADESSADHEEIAAGPEGRFERPRVRFRAQVMHARHSDWKMRHLLRSRTGGDHQRVVVQSLLIVQQNAIAPYLRR